MPKLGRRRTETAAIEKLAEAGVQGPPVDVASLAAREGVDVIREPMDNPGVLGMLYRRSGTRSVILINSTHDEHRNRFTIAHELGHYLLHRGGVYVSSTARIHFRDADATLETHREEVEANKFGAALLMPADWTVAEANRHLRRNRSLSDEDLVVGLAKVFRVTHQAMGYRLVNLGVIAPLADR